MSPSFGGSSGYNFFGHEGSCPIGFVENEPSLANVGFTAVFDNGYGQGYLLDTATNYFTIKLFRLFISRLGSGVFGVVILASNDDFETLSAVHYHGVASHSGVDSGVVTTSAVGQHFATRHPVTCQITRSTTPVCVV